jgi:hypothetical protein
MFADFQEYMAQSARLDPNNELDRYLAIAPQFKLDIAAVQA